MFTLSITILVAFVGFIGNSVSAKTWKYTLDNFEYNTTNANILSASLRPIRISPGVYAMNGSIKIGIDIDDQYTLSVKLLRSASGTTLYQMTPYATGNLTVSQFMNTIYKNILMEDASKCSNLPTFEHFTEPFPSGEYFINSCLVSTKSMPSHMPSGGYKVILEGLGPGERAVGIITAQVTAI